MGYIDIYSYTAHMIDADTALYANQFVIKREPAGDYNAGWYIYDNAYTVSIPEGETYETAFFNRTEVLTGPRNKLVERSFSRPDDAMQYVRRHFIHPKDRGKRPSNNDVNERRDHS